MDTLTREEIANSYGYFKTLESKRLKRHFEDFQEGKLKVKLLIDNSFLSNSIRVLEIVYELINDGNEKEGLEILRLRSGQLKTLINANNEDANSVLTSKSIFEEHKKFKKTVFEEKKSELEHEINLIPNFKTGVQELSSLHQSLFNILSKNIYSPSGKVVDDYFNLYGGRKLRNGKKVISDSDKCLYVTGLMLANNNSLQQQKVKTIILTDDSDFKTLSPPYSFTESGKINFAEAPLIFYHGKTENHFGTLFFRQYCLYNFEKRKYGLDKGLEKRLQEA